MVNLDRVRKLKEGENKKGPVVYWMQRDQRVNDNWALTYAYSLAATRNEKLLVVFNLVTKFLDATMRQYFFMIEGLKEVSDQLNKKNIQFEILLGEPSDNILQYLTNNNVSILVTDFNPLKIIKNWKTKIANEITIPFYEVDAHNVVPVWKASEKLEFAAYTIRPKINKLLPTYLEEFSIINKMKTSEVFANSINWNEIYKSLSVDKSVQPNKEFIPGTKASEKILKTFIQAKLDNYNSDRNDPNKTAISNLSPYLHFGHISSQRIALTLQNFVKEDDSVASFLEELVIRKELSDNFCFYNDNYDRFEGFHNWAQNTLNDHREDKREYLYSIDDFETAQTHDLLWNAAQLEMVNTGKMHGFMRMYWAKKLLEWTESPEQALEFGIFLNDKYELDGRDPNGYKGLAWSIGGVHDRAWAERPVYGKVRYMNYNGCKRKFDVNSYIGKQTDLSLFKTIK